MAIRVTCPVCSYHIVGPDKSGGKKATCPNCTQIVVLPMTSTILEPTPDAGAPKTDFAHRTPTLLEIDKPAPTNLPPALEVPWPMPTESASAAPSVAEATSGSPWTPRAGVQRAAAKSPNNMWLIGGGAAGAVVALALLVIFNLPKTAEKNSGDGDGNPVVKPGGGDKKIFGNPGGGGDTVDALIRKLDSPKDRLETVQALGELGSKAKGAIRKLIPLWIKQDDLGLAVQRALDKIGAPDKIDYELVVDRLEDANPEVQKYAARTISGMVETVPADAIRKTINALIQALEKSAVVEVREHAAIVLPKIGKEHFEKVVPALLNAVGDDDAAVSRKARAGLTALDLNGEKDLGSIQLTLDRDNWRASLFAIEILAQGKVSEEIANELIKAAQWPKRLTRSAVSGKDQALILECREKAIEGLGKAEAKVAFPALMDALDDEEKIQKAALASLAKLGTPPASQIDQLVHCLKHKNTAVQLYAVASFEKIDGRTEKHLASLAECLRDQELKVAYLTATTLGKIGKAAHSVARELQNVIDNKEADKELRRQAMVALGNIGPADKSVLTLRQVLLDPKSAPELRKSAAEAWGRIADQNDEAGLTGLVAKEDLGVDVRLELVKTLGRLSGEKKVKDFAYVASELQKVANKEEADKKLRRQVVLALCEIGRAKGSVETVISALVNDPELGKTALEAFNNFAPFEKADMDGLVSLLDSKQSGDVRSFAARKLGAIKGDSGKAKRHAAVKPLTEALKIERDPEVQRDMVKALGTIGPDAKSAIPTLTNTLLMLQRENINRKKVPGVLLVLHKNQLLITIEPVFFCSIVVPATEGTPWKSWLIFVVKTRSARSLANAGPAI